MPSYNSPFYTFQGDEAAKLGGILTIVVLINALGK